jgi:predicted transcriptional regulator
MYRCNLSFKQLKQYSGLLMKRGLLNMVSEVGSSSHGWFEVTDKGKEFLKAYEGLMTLMN